MFNLYRHMWLAVIWLGTAVLNYSLRKLSLALKSSTYFNYIVISNFL